ncbi:MAG: B12-binding domain-containing protein [Nitrososphaerota archaeon]
MSEQSAGADNSARQDSPNASARLARAYLEALRAADTAGAYRVASRAMAAGMPLAAVYQSVITPAMHELGTLWEKGVITVADEHAATAVTMRVLGALRPAVLGGSSAGRDTAEPRAMLAAVEGEQHVLGLRMVADLLEEIGYRAVYLGADVPTEALLQAIDTFSPALLGLTATMPDSGAELERIAPRLREAHPRLALLVGGQASAARQLGGTAPPVEDLRALDQRVKAP